MTETSHESDTSYPEIHLTIHHRMKRNATKIENIFDGLAKRFIEAYQIREIEALVNGEADANPMDDAVLSCLRRINGFLPPPPPLNPHRSECASCRSTVEAWHR